MKKQVLFFLSALLSLTVGAQTLNVNVGNVTYQFPATQTGDMTFTNGSSLTIMGKTFAVSTINSIYTDNTSVINNQVTISYNGSTATVTVAGNVAQYVEPTIDGAHVTIAQSNTADVDGEEITYVLSGSSSDGEFALSGTSRCTISLAGVTLTNTEGAAINITNKKRIQISAKKNTENTLTDCSNGSQKGCIYSKGQIQLQGNGTLTVYGRTAHAIKSGDYISVKNLTLNVKSAVKDGINCNKYFLMKSGTVSISGVSDDGIQCELESDDDNTGETADHEDENSGNVYFEDGDITITVTGAATKGVKAEGDMIITGGDIAVTTSGTGAYDSDEKDAKGCAGLKTDGDMTISGGTLTLKNTGSGGKCIKVDGLLTVNDGAVVNATNTGSTYTYGSYSASAKAIKAGTRTLKSGRTANSHKKTNPAYDFTGGIIFNGGTVTASASNHEAIESKSTIDVNGGYVYAYSKDDAINSASTFTISGGYVMGNSTGNDGLDANGDCYVKGGTVFAVAKREPEVGIDANTEQGFSLYVQGGNIVSIGGLENGSTLSQSCYQASSYSQGASYGLYSNGTLVLAFKVPSNGSNMGTPMVVSTAGTATLSSGVTTGGTTFWNGYGFTTANGGSSVSLSSYTGGNGGGGGPGGGGGGPGGGGGWH